MRPLAAFAAEPDAATLQLLRRGGLVLVMRHALAPGTFDPPDFNVNVCSTQRNLSDEGRAQARRIGQWFARHQLKPAVVRSSPWCRCIDTATLAFGSAQPWTALASPVGSAASTNLQSQRELGLAIAASSAQAGRFEVWVTHQFVINDLAGVATDSGEGVLLRADVNAHANNIPNTNTIPNAHTIPNPNSATVHLVGRMLLF